MTITRRNVLAAAAALTACPVQVLLAGDDAAAGLAAIEARTGGRIGVAALDTATGRRLAHRGDERFAMCSTFKWLLAAAVLVKVDKNQLRLDAMVPYGKKDPLGNSPVTAAHVQEGGLPLATLCEAVVEVSDNGAANLLLARIGGPAGYTAFARSMGDTVTRLDRTEMSLNSNLRGDPRDTTTANACIATMDKVLLGDVLKPESRDRLLGWMKASSTGLDRLRAGLPAAWTAGDKTGTGVNGAVNDLAIAWPSPNRKPILIAAYFSDSKQTTEELSKAHADIGRLVAAAFG